MRILVANRGEIACRIAATCRRLGIGTVGIYSEPDRSARHVDEVDVAVALGGSTPSESYLRGDAVVAAALAAGADAVHPGYGFLAENAEFAESVIDAGLLWIGPTPEQIRLLGDKVAAKRAAVEAGVPTTDIVELAAGEIPSDLPIPALVKAAAGGGGRGMRVVRHLDDLADAVEAAAREAAAAFGDGTVFVEPFIEHGRHIEVQILGDAHGNVVHLGDRDCSIQRRNQKVVEEAPAPHLDDDTRRRLHDGAIALARHVGYVGAGTVEFMVDSSPAAGGVAPTITFLEVNTRLQVEHPVTEAITGLDLVELQIAVAEGRPLPFTQDEVTFDGHAIEVRVVAEDPTAGWLPSTGRLHEFVLPDLDGRLRIDTGFRAGSEVAADYDSLLAKVVAHHAERGVAVDQIARAMRTARIAGVRTNAAMLAATMATPSFRDGGVTTTFLDDHPEVSGAIGPTGADRSALVVASTIADERRHRANDHATGFAPSGWRNLRTRGQRRSWIDTHLDAEGPSHHLEYVVTGDRVDVLVGVWPEPGDDGSLPTDERARLDVRVLDHRIDGATTDLAIEADGHRHRIRVVAVTDDTVLASGSSGSVELRRPPRWVDHDAIATGGGPICPLPGTVIAVHVAAGDRVTDGDLLMVVEAMKMEHRITAATDAVVSDVRFAVGDRVDSGDLLVALEAPTEDT